MKLMQAKTIVKKLAEGKIHSVQFDLTETASGQISTSCSVYVGGKGWYTGDTWVEAINKLKEAITGESQKIEEFEQGV